MNWQKLKHASLDDILHWAESQPWCRAMADCAQDAEWHSEGDVWTHTKMVCQQLAKLEDWSTLTSDEQTLLLFTALFHDAAKPLTSECDPETGRITSPKHAVKGEHLTRGVLRDLGCDLATREVITRLVRYHGRPAFLLERSEPVHEVVRLSWLVSNRLLYLFETRQRWIDLFADHNARIELVYVEPQFDLLLRQNEGRENPVPEQVVRKLAAKCEPPTWAECHTLLLVDGETT